MARTQKSPKPAIDRSLDEFESYLKANGNADTSVAAIIIALFDDPQPSVEKVTNAVDLLKKDPRFILSGGGIMTHVRVATVDELKPEPETIEAADDDDTPTLGELVEEAKAEEAARPAERPIDPAHSAEHVAMIRKANDLYRTCEADETRCSKQLSVLRKKRKEAAFHLSEVIGGQASILDVNGDVRQPPPSADPVAKRKSGKAKKPAKAKAPTPPKPRGKTKSKKK